MALALELTTSTCRCLSPPEGASASAEYSHLCYQEELDIRRCSI